MDLTYVSTPNLQVTKPVTKRSSARHNISPYKKTTNVELEGTTPRLQPQSENTQDNSVQLRLV